MGILLPLHSLHSHKQVHHWIDSMLQCISSEHRWGQNVVRTKKWHTSLKCIAEYVTDVLTTLRHLLLSTVYYEQVTSEENSAALSYCTGQWYIGKLFCRFFPRKDLKLTSEFECQTTVGWRDTPPSWDMLCPTPCVGGAVASWLVCSSPERVVRVRVLAGDIVLCSWARHFTFTVPHPTET